MLNEVSQQQTFPKKKKSTIAGEIAGAGGLISRTGYTGEDGCELIVPAETALACGKPSMPRPSQSAARPPGSGHAIRCGSKPACRSTATNSAKTSIPFQAGLGFAVNLKDRTFPGRDALARLSDDSTRPVRVAGNSPASACRAKATRCWSSGEAIGRVTSGTFSPTLEQADRHGLRLARAWRAGHRSRRSTFAASQEPARTVELPFYREPAKAPSGIRMTPCSRKICSTPRRTNGSTSIATAGQKIATVGISHFAVEALTDLVYLELPESRPPGEGRRVVRRDRIGQGRQRSVQPGERRDRRSQRQPGRPASTTATTIPTATAGS